jgi:hypothetical protein
MTIVRSKLTQLCGRLLVWAHRRGSALELLAIVIFLGGVLAWLFGFTDLRGLLSALGGAAVAWAVGALVYKTLGS